MSARKKRLARFRARHDDLSDHVEVHVRRRVAVTEGVLTAGRRIVTFDVNHASGMIRSFNEQWRVCFRWTDVGPEAVEIVDYH